MKKQFFWITLALLCCSLFHAQCITGCNDNTFLNSGNPNTIEYDNMIGTFHSSIIKEVDGTVKIWGASARPNGSSDVLSPQPVTAANGYNYTGTILKMTAASNFTSQQFAILTTDGLYIWGDTGIIVKNSVYTKNTTSFGKMAVTAAGTNTYGLPTDVNPTDVKMLFGSYGTLGIVTCSGAAWILSFTGTKNGDGTSQNSGGNTANNTDVVWHRISTTASPLANVTAIRGISNAMIALTSTGDLYTWGTGTYSGDGVTGATSRTHATKMTLPAGMTGTPKMIGMTVGNSYYLLTTTGELWSLGNNSSRQLGDFTNTSRTSWIRVKKTATENMDTISWFSPQEHDNQYAVISALTTNGKLWSWGDNQGNMLGTGAGASNPLYMIGGLDANDKLIALETGGHTTMVIRQCSKKYGYIGHRTNGSMGNGSSASGYETIFNFNDTAEVTLCGAPTSPQVKNIKICNGTTADLISAITGNTPAGMAIVWYTTSTRTPGTKVTDPASVGTGTYYAFFEPTDISNCNAPSASVPVTVTYYMSGEPGSENCYCTQPGSLLPGGLPTKLGITGQTRLPTWPEALPNGHIAMESKTNGFVITRVASSSLITEPKKGMLIYDIAAACVKLYNGSLWKCIERKCND